MLKAITASLLMEQVMAPNFNFKLKKEEDDLAAPGEIIIPPANGKIVTNRVAKIIEDDLVDLKASILQDKDVSKAIVGTIDPEVITYIRE